MKKNVVFILFLVFFSGLSFAQIMIRDEKTVSVIAQGWGKKVGDTKHDAMKNGIMAIIQDILASPIEQENLRKNLIDSLVKSEKYIFDYKIKRKIRQKGKRNGKKYKMTMTLELKVNRDALYNDLEEWGLIHSFTDLRRQLNHFTLMPYVDEQKSSPEIVEKKDLVYARIGSFLQNRHIPFIGEEEIRKIKADEEIIALEKSASANDEEDLMVQLARNTHADFYIKIVGHADKSHIEGSNFCKVSISITVFAVMTGENISSQSSYSHPLSLSSEEISISAGIEEAINGIMDDILAKLRMFWKEYIRKGRPYKLIFYDYTFNEFASIRRVLKELSPQVKLVMKAGNIAAFIIWYKGPVDEVLFEIPGRVELNLKESPSILGNTIRFFRTSKKRNR